MTFDDLYARVTGGSVLPRPTVVAAVAPPVPLSVLADISAKAISDAGMDLSDDDYAARLRRKFS